MFLSFSRGTKATMSVVAVLALLVEVIYPTSLEHTLHFPEAVHVLYYSSILV